jgi:hypothetical protein
MAGRGVAESFTSIGFNLPPAAGPLGGAIFETAVLLQIVKVFVNHGEEPQDYFWRTSAGVEGGPIAIMQYCIIATAGARCPSIVAWLRDAESHSFGSQF